MPFDGSSSSVILVTSIAEKPARKRISWRKRSCQLLGAITIIGVVSVFSEVVFPESGVISIIADGPTIAWQNHVAHDLLINGKRLQFSVGSWTYTVISPNHVLSADETTAWFGYADRKGLPRYTVDGPMAVDP